MKNNDPEITAWLVPKWAITGFTNAAKEAQTDSYVYSILEATPSNFCVITHGYNAIFIERLNHYLNKLFEVRID